MELTTGIQQRIKFQFPNTTALLCLRSSSSSSTDEHCYRLKMRVSRYLLPIPGILRPANQARMTSYMDVRKSVFRVMTRQHSRRCARSS